MSPWPVGCRPVLNFFLYFYFFLHRYKKRELGAAGDRGWAGIKTTEWPLRSGAMNGASACSGD